MLNMFVIVPKAPPPLINFNLAGIIYYYIAGILNLSAAGESSKFINLSGNL